MRKRIVAVISAVLTVAVIAGVACASVLGSVAELTTVTDPVKNVGTANAAGVPSAEKVQDNTAQSNPAESQSSSAAQSSEAQSPAQSAAFDLQSIEKIISLNRVYGDFISDDNALIEEAEVALLDYAEENGEFFIIKKELVNAFIFNVYGRTVDENAGKYEMYTPPEGYYAILPRGYSLISNKITEINELGNGNLQVKSDMFVSFYDTSDGSTALQLVTVLAPSDSSIYGYNIIGAEIVDDLANSGLYA